MCAPAKISPWLAVARFALARPFHRGEISAHAHVSDNVAVHFVNEMLTYARMIIENEAAMPIMSMNVMSRGERGMAASACPPIAAQRRAPSKRMAVGARPRPAQRDQRVCAPACAHRDGSCWAASMAIINPISGAKYSSKPGLLSREM